MNTHRKHIYTNLCICGNNQIYTFEYVCVFIKNKRRGIGLAIMCCCSLTNESLNACESWFWQHRCSHWSGRLLQQKGVSHSLAGCGSKKLWQSQEEQLVTRNHPCEFHTGALTLTSCSPLEIIPEKGGKYETRKQESWWLFMFWVCFPHVYEYFKWVRKIPL